MVNFSINYLLIAFHGYHDLKGNRGTSIEYVSFVDLSNAPLTLSPKNVIVVQAIVDEAFYLIYLYRCKQIYLTLPTTTQMQSPIMVLRSFLCFTSDILWYRSLDSANSGWWLEWFHILKVLRIYTFVINNGVTTTEVSYELLTCIPDLNARLRNKT